MSIDLSLSAPSNTAGRSPMMMRMDMRWQRQHDQRVHHPVKVQTPAVAIAYQRLALTRRIRQAVTVALVMLLHHMGAPVAGTIGAPRIVIDHRRAQHRMREAIRAAGRAGSSARRVSSRPLRCSDSTRLAGDAGSRNRQRSTPSGRRAARASLDDAFFLEVLQRTGMQRRSAHGQWRWTS